MIPKATDEQGKLTRYWHRGNIGRKGYSKACRTRARFCIILHRKLVSRCSVDLQFDSLGMGVWRCELVSEEAVPSSPEDFRYCKAIVSIWKSDLVCQ